jgi:gamma-glutamyltranspeptidase / glutathione hydrolase
MVKSERTPNMAKNKSIIIAALLASALLITPKWADAASPLPVAAEKAMVVTAHRLATKIGVDVLKQGGNAIDAAVAVGYALAVTFPEAGNLGGGGFMTISFRDGRKAFIDFRETAPGAATKTMFQDAAGNVVPERSRRGYLAAGIPGTVAGLELARTKYGTMARPALMAASIQLARNGFVLDQGDADMLADGAEDFRKDAPSAAIFLANNKPRLPGTRLVQTDLARSLQLIASNGPSAFYSGDITKKLVVASQKNGGIFAMSDFANYRAVERKPLECNYRGWQVISAPPPSSGGTVICETLNILEGYPVGELGFNSAQGTHYMIEALRRSFRDRNLNLGDPAFVKFDADRYVSKEYAAELRKGISPDKATSSDSLKGAASGKEGQSTTHYSIVDQQGNAVSVTYTLNDWFGARVTAAGTGILLNDEMDDFSAKPGASNMFGLVEGENNAVAPGKRPLSSMSPTIVTKDGQLVMVVGTPGGSRIPTAVLQVIMNVLDHKMTLQEAVDAPRIHQQWMPDVTYFERNALSVDTMKLLAAKGQKLEEIEYGNHIAAILVGAPGIGQKPLGKNRLYGSIDPRLNLGTAAGY